MKAIILISLLALSSCATSYQRDGFSGGYSENQVAADTFEVHFRGNGYTGQRTVQEYLKRRCAELTIERGYTHYVMVNSKDMTDSYIQQYGDSVGMVNKPTSTAVIKMINNPSKDIVAYDAYLILGKQRAPANE